MKLYVKVILLTMLLFSLEKMHAHDRIQEYAHKLSQNELLSQKGIHNLLDHYITSPSYFFLVTLREEYDYLESLQDYILNLKFRYQDNFLNPTLESVNFHKGVLTLAIARIIKTSTYKTHIHHWLSGIEDCLYS